MTREERIRYVGKHKKAAPQIEAFAAQLEAKPELNTLCADLKQSSRELWSRSQVFYEGGITAAQLAPIRVRILTTATCLSIHGDEAVVVAQNIMAFCNWLDRAHLPDATSQDEV